MSKQSFRLRLLEGRAVAPCNDDYFERTAAACSSRSSLTTIYGLRTQTTINFDIKVRPHLYRASTIDNPLPQPFHVRAPSNPNTPPNLHKLARRLSPVHQVRQTHTTATIYVCSVLVHTHPRSAPCGRVLSWREGVSSCSPPPSPEQTEYISYTYLSCASHTHTSLIPSHLRRCVQIIHMRRSMLTHIHTHTRAHTHPDTPSLLSGE